MSLETLQNDLKLNLADLAALKPETAAADPALAIREILGHLKDTLWPTLEAIVDELTEVDDCVADLVAHADDILQPETAAVFAAVVASSTTITAALKLRITREADPQLFKVIEEHEKNLKEATEIMKEIVIDDGEGLDDEEDDDDDEDEDDDENEGEDA